MSHPRASMKGGMQQSEVDMTSDTIGDEVTYRDRVLGTMLGGAIGDALGAAVEFSSLSTIRRLYGPEGIRAYANAYGGRGRWTDDTQMTLFTAEGLLDAATAGADNRTDVVDHIHAAYRRWYGTQTGHGPGGSGLTALASMHHRRAPGATCLSALAQAEPGRVDHPVNDSKGCGGVMRVAPLGVLDDSFAVANAAAALTHGHPSGWLAAGALASMIGSLLRGAHPGEAVDSGLESVRSEPDSDEVVQAVEVAISLTRTAPVSAETVERLGAGWVAEEALAIAVYAFLVADDFDAAIFLGANHSGDSDSTASIAGQLFGAHAGGAAIPDHWLRDLEMADEIASLAEALAGTYPSNRRRRP